MNKIKSFKRAFTLVEILIGLAILSIIASAGLGGINAYRIYTINLSNDHCRSEIVLFFSKSRSYSFNNNIEGHIRINTEENRLTFSTKNRLVYEYKLQSKKLQDSNFKDNKIYIKSSGKIDVAGTLSFKDERNSLHKITIHVGTGYVDEKE